jgi:hypothetical protein
MQLTLAYDEGTYTYNFIYQKACNNMFENYRCQVRCPKARDILNNSPCLFISSNFFYLPNFLIILCYFQGRGLSLNLSTHQG